MLRKHKKEQKQFEITTAKILAMFSELDPNPIMRINSAGLITSLNKSAKERALKQRVLNAGLDFKNGRL